MRKFFISLYFILSIALPSLSQVGFEEGYLLSSANDTIQGFIRTQPIEGGDFLCVFKKNLSADPQHYNATEVKEFRFSSGRRFLSNQFDLKFDTTDVQFIEHLVSGLANLYYVKGAYILVKQDNVPVVLNWFQIQDKNFIYEGPKVGLNFLISDCSNIKISSSNIEYNHAYLIKIIKKYNESCYDVPVEVFYSEAYKSGSYFGLLVGSNISSLSSESSGKIMSDPYLSFGAQYRLILPSVRNNFSLNANVYYLNQKFVVNNSAILGNGSTLYREYDFDNNSLKISTLAGAMIVNNKINVDLSAGLFFSTPISSDSYIISETYNDMVVDTEIETLNNETMFGPVLGLLLFYELNNGNIIGLEFRSDFVLGFQEQVETNSYGVQLSYLLKTRKNR